VIQFQVGDKAVYPAQGVGEIIGIDEKSVSGKTNQFYCLRILDTDVRILVPLNNAEQVGLRPVIGLEDIEGVYDVLRHAETCNDRQTWNRRYRGFMDKVKTGNLFEIAEVFRDLHRLKRTKTLAFGERRMLDTVRSLIVKELSVAKGLSETKIEDELMRTMLSM
jgi:CarD family transcriptional regulator